MLTVRACRPQRARELRLLDLVTPTTNRNINQIKIRNPHKMQILCPPRENPILKRTKKYNLCVAWCPQKKSLTDSSKNKIFIPCFGYAQWRPWWIAPKTSEEYLLPMLAWQYGLRHWNHVERGGARRYAAPLISCISLPGNICRGNR